MNINIRKTAMIGVILSSALVLGACNHNKGVVTNQSGGIQQSAGATSQPAQGDSVAITYLDNGFSPREITVKVGQQVTFTNTTSATVQVNSAPHPTHELFPELNLNGVSAGGSKSTSFTKAGTYTYHNHLNASQNGKIIVE